MIIKPKTISKLLLIVLCTFIATSSFAAEYKSKLTTPVNGQEASDARIEEGSKLFSTKCASCHKLDKKVVGPALQDVVSKYDADYDYLIDWIQNNSALISSGDPRAVEASQMEPSAMNTFTELSDDQVTSILMWIENGGDGPSETADTAGAVAPPPVDESVFNKINWGIVLLSVVIFIILLLIIGILELVGNITGKQIINWNNVNAFMMLIFLFVFFALVLYEYAIHKQYLLPEASSDHGIELDKMMRWTFIATLPVFFITQFLLFWFSFRYREKPGRKAYYYPHNNNLEYIWTFIPAVVLTILVLGGLKSWKNIVKTDAPEGTQQVELFAYQFGWQARFPGTDQQLGNHDFNLISATNPLGIANLEHAKELVKELEAEIKTIEARIEDLGKEESKLRATLGGLVGDERKEHLKKIEAYASGDIKEDLELTIRARHTQIERINKSIEAAKESQFYNGQGDDDVVVQELHLVIDKPVTLKFRARDVIHSAYLPYFRAQMNVVPGLPTNFTFTPNKTTNEMRRLKGDTEWDYYLVCNKICGNAHFNMKLKVVVEDQASYDEWMAKQTGFFAKVEEQPETPAVEAGESQEEEKVEQPEDGLAIN